MEVTELENLFDVTYGNKFDANKMKFISEGDINFISRTSRNNGCVGTVKMYKNIDPYNPGLITVSLGGSYLLSSFLQPKSFYTAQNVAVLSPKTEMTINDKIFYCKCISMNRFKYSAFGREANKTLKTLEVPKEVPEWVQESTISRTFDLKKPFRNKKLSLQSCEMKDFPYSKLFEIKKGKRIVISKQTEEGDCPFVSSIDKNNGIKTRLNIIPNQSGNTITVNYNGSIGEAFYQPDPFWASDDVNILYPKFKLNPFIAMFLITMIKKEKYRFNYGRKWHSERMEKSMIRLPVDKNGDPDWNFIENFIKGLSYSKYLDPVNETTSNSEINENIQQVMRLQKTLTDF